ITAARARADSLRKQLDALERETYLRPERLVQLREQARLRRSDLLSERDRIADRIAAIEELRAAWTERRGFWTRWRDAVADDKDVPRGTRSDFAGALKQIQGVLAHTGEVYADALQHQRAFAGVQRELVSIEALADELIRQGRARRWHRDTPLFSWEFARRLGRVSTLELVEGVAATPVMDAPFLRRSSWVLLLHALAVFGVAVVIRRIHSRAPEAGASDTPFARPFVTGALVATALISVFYQPMPALWELLIIITLALTGALQASLVFPERPDRQLIYAIATVYPLLFALEITAFPAPLFRLVFAIVCTLGAPVLLLIALRHGRGDPLARRVRLASFAGAGILLLALLGQLIGFEAIARWLLQSAVATAFLGYIVAYLVRLGSASITVLAAAPREAGFIERAGQGIATHARWLVRTAMLTAAALFIAEVWGVIPSVDELWSPVLDLGVPIGATRLTLGRVLAAVVIVYATFVVSWLLRILLDVHVFERREVEPGVGDSIKAILHYTMVVLGSFWALASLGISLENFALIAGALSVGIGFGLQNIVNNFVSGLILLFERPVRVGDTVVIAGEWGTVRRIGLRSTIIQTFDRSELIVPNSDLVSEKVSNWTLSDRVTRVIVPVGVAYGSPVPTVIEILERVARAHPECTGEPDVEILFVGFGESSLDFEIRMWIREALLKLKVRSDVLKEVERELNEHEIEIPFPQRDLHLRSIDAGVALPLADSRGASKRSPR
ncbi:MAG: mechanosensitive ion channel, partial [Myxococcales bacterium]|nr:mechanosensitive ion channel [Myxococcales bacterium]